MSNELTAINESLQRNKENLVADLKRIVGDADDLMKELSNSTSEELATMRKRIEASLGDARARIHDARIVFTKNACHAADVTNEYIGENPWKVAGVASMIGLLAALLIFRRSSR
jgi:ElaB/YqjD/DUF883 family membrane-anchored ribosome-binding protein